MREDDTERGISAFDALAILWRGKFIIILTTALSLFLAGVLYFSVPRTYESSLDIEPLRQADFSNFQGLISAELFPYDRASLFNEFIGYVRNTELLIPVALETGVVRSDPANEALSRRDARLFVQGIDFSQPDKESAVMNMRVRSLDEQALDRFVTTALDRANARFAERIHFEITQRMTAQEERRLWDIEKVQTEIAARRSTGEALRKDRIELLTRQAEVARQLSLKQPTSIASDGAGASPGEAVSVQVSAGDQPAYFQGYIALEEQIRHLKSRDVNDPYVAGLRELQQQIFLLKNSPDQEFQSRLLEASPLSEPQNARLVYYDLVRATARKVFPKVSIFGPAALVFGLLIGATIVLWRAQPQRPAKQI